MFNDIFFLFENRAHKVNSDQKLSFFCGTVTFDFYLLNAFYIYTVLSYTEYKCRIRLKNIDFQNFDPTGADL